MIGPPAVGARRMGPRTEAFSFPASFRVLALLLASFRPIPVVVLPAATTLVASIGVRCFSSFCILAFATTFLAKTFVFAFDLTK